MTNVIPLTTSYFLEKIYNYELNPADWIYLGRIPGIIMFHSPSSNFCADLEPALEIIAKRGKGKYNVYTVNADAEKRLASIFMVDSIPTFYLCPMKGDPTIVKGTINIIELTSLISKIVIPRF